MNIRGKEKYYCYLKQDEIVIIYSSREGESSAERKDGVLSMKGLYERFLIITLTNKRSTS